MSSSVASRPIVILFERHWDLAPKQVFKNLLPRLSQEGYDTLCFEAPQNLSQEEILHSYRHGLEIDEKIYASAKEHLSRVGLADAPLSDMSFRDLTVLMKLFVSSQKYVTVAEKIKNLPSSQCLKGILEDAVSRSMGITGVDMDAEGFHSMVAEDLSKRMRVIEKNEECRVEAFVRNLSKLRHEGKGIIFSCGVLHAENLIKKLKDETHEEVLYYFSHSDRMYDDSLNEVKEYLSNDTLKDHTFCLLNDADQRKLTDKIVEEVKQKITL